MVVGAPGIATRSKGIATSNKKLLGLLALLLGARMVVGAPGIATRSKGIATSNKKLLGAPRLTTRSKDGSRGSWHRY